MIMKGLFFPILSLQKPETAFNREAVLSAIPSIIDKVVLDAPMDKRKSGITLYTIFVDVSVKKLVRPVKKTFLSNPKYFLLSITLLTSRFDVNMNFDIVDPASYFLLNLVTDEVDILQCHVFRQTEVKICKPIMS